MSTSASGRASSALGIWAHMEQNQPSQFVRLIGISRINPKIATGTPDEHLPEYQEDEFRQWMRVSGVSEGTIEDYVNAVRRYLAFLGESVFPIRRAFLNFDVPPGMLRLTGFALRRLTRYWREVDGMDIDLACRHD